MIVITGASSGLGAELAKRYDAEGKETYVIGRNTEKLSALAKQLSHNVGYQACNLSLHQGVKQLFDGMKQPPEMVIHSAGSGYFGLLEEQEPEEIQKLIDNNLNSAIHVLRELVKRY
ncbi:SDR family NAD(P)-dependent oxidoreductase, partial [Vibrio parahaemolyticus]|nr:SDR family NAD(P)-dependent oxidoreductase [Vibrio parahaemolyticus]